MPTYGAPWQALLNNTPTPVDTVDNPVFDQLMGFSADPNDDGVTSFIKGLQSSMARNTPEGRQMTQEIMKAKLANQMQMQLMQEKLQLAKQNPEYKVVNTPWGANLINPLDPNDVHAVENAPNAKDAYAAQLAAKMKMDQYNASPTHMQALEAEDQAKPGLMQAQTNFYNARPGLMQAQTDADKARAALAAAGGAKAAQGMSLKDATAKAAQDVFGIYISDPDIAGAQLQEAAKKDPAKAQKFLQLRDQYMQSRVGSGGLASPQGSQQNPPDLSNLLNPNTLGQ